MGKPGRFKHPGPWITKGACAKAPPEVFFPTKGGHQAVAKVIDQYCARCPVRLQCLDYAMEAGPMLTGIWSGTSQNWRRNAANKAAWSQWVADGRPVEGPSETSAWPTSGGLGLAGADLGDPAPEMRELSCA